MRRISFPGQIASLAPVSVFLEELIEEAGLDVKGGYGLQLAVDELVTNIITHAYEECGRTGEVVFEVELGEKELTLVIEDSGEFYDPTRKPPPEDLDKPLEERQIGGLGIYLALQSVDQFRYERKGDRNRNIIVMRRPGASTE
jgi:anti-sigma regulatory factor (Ser/Thr protein kinase)